MIDRPSRIDAVRQQGEAPKAARGEFTLEGPSERYRVPVSASFRS